MMNNKLKKIFHSNEPYIFLIIILLGVLVQIRSGQFFTGNNLVDLFSALIVPGLFAIGEFMTLLSGGIDVSFPALASLSVYATTKLLLDQGYQGNVIAAFVIAIAFGAVLGALNGFLIGYLNLNAMIVTLGTSSIFQGLMQGTLRANQLSTIPAGMKAFGTVPFISATNKVNGLTSVLPYTFLVLVGVCVLMYLVLHYTIFGRGIYAIGGNASSAHAAGFNVKRTKFIMYIIIGMIASAAGICRTCMMQQMHPTNMLGMEMNIIAGVVLGGVALTGGSGSLLGCMLGTFLIVMVQNSMILIGIPTTWSDVFVGAVIIIGVIVSALQSNRYDKVRTSKNKEAAAK
ncbi:MAG: ABC transporter permease [Clostridiales bacterium]|jgi:simple sugar transport system permease protein|nr:ABC transporter permease [Clostridiales bacterium]